MDRAFDFLHVNERESKPREKGITEIRGPYYDPMGISWTKGTVPRPLSLNPGH